MPDFPYTPNAASLERFFSEIQTVGKPSKVSFKWLSGIGFKSSNDRYITGILKALGFTDGSSVPTERWQAYRNKQQGRAVMAQALVEAYPALFETYPDAYRKDDEALRNFFGTHTSVGEKAVAYMVRTFKTLTEMADFDSAIPSAPVQVPPVRSDSKEIVKQIEIPAGKDVTINVNIQLQLFATDDASIYDKLFEALKKHVLS